MFCVYRPPGDCWTRLAVLVNLLEKLDYQPQLLSDKCLEGNSENNTMYLIQRGKDGSIKTPLYHRL